MFDICKFEKLKEEARKRVDSSLSLCDSWEEYQRRCTQYVKELQALAGLPQKFKIVYVENAGDDYLWASTSSLDVVPTDVLETSHKKAKRGVVLIFQLRESRELLVCASYCHWSDWYRDRCSMAVGMWKAFEHVAAIPMSVVGSADMSLWSGHPEFFSQFPKSCLPKISQCLFDFARSGYTAFLERELVRAETGQSQVTGVMLANALIENSLVASKKPEKKTRAKPKQLASAAKKSPKGKR